MVMVDGYCDQVRSGYWTTGRYKDVSYERGECFKVTLLQKTDGGSRW